MSLRGDLGEEGDRPMWWGMRPALAAVVTAGVLAVAGQGVAATPSDPGRLVPVSGPSPFTGCPAAGLDPLLPVGEVEPVVVANPAEPGNVVTAWTQDRFHGIVVGASFDDGRTWRRAVVPGLTRCTGGTFDYADDLSMSAGRDGTVYLSTHVFDADRQRSGLLATRSTDGGRTWSPPATLAVQTGSRNGEYAGGAIAADPAGSSVFSVVPTFSYPAGPGGSFRGTVVFSRSVDGGRTWQPARTVLDAGAGWLTTGHQLAVLPGGMLLDVFTLIDVRKDPWRPALQVAVTRSSDRGGTWSPPTVVADIRSVGVTDPESGDPVAGGTRLQPAVSVDRSSGRVYVAWQDARFSGGQADAIALARSADDGATWTTPEKVNATPTNIPVPDQQAFAPNLAVAPDGTLAVSYFDFRHNDDAASLPTDRWLVRCHPIANPACTARPARPETRLTPRSFDMRQAHRFTSVGPPGFFLGDYMGLASTGRSFIAVFAQPHDDDPASIFAATRPSAYGH
jgi:hypothetical protein